MMKSLRKWLEKSGYNPGKIKLFGGGEALEVSTPYQGQTPTAEQFAILAEIRRHVSRHYAGIKVEPRGFYSSIYIYYNNQPDAFRLFVVRFACFWQVCALLPFCFSQISGGVFAIQKNKRLFFILPDVFRFGLDAKKHSTLTTLYISRILILYIYVNCYRLTRQKSKIDTVERLTIASLYFVYLKSVK